MVFLANENIPSDSIELLRAYNCKVISIKEEFRGANDLAVIEIANQYNAVILTFDKDYGEIIFKSDNNNFPSVIFFRFKGYDSLFAGTTLIQLLQNSSIKLEGFFTVV